MTQSARRRPTAGHEHQREVVEAAWSPLWSLWLPLGLRTQQAKLHPEEQLLQGWLTVELVPHWRMDFGLRLFVCVLGDLLSPLRPPRLQWRDASGAQIFWETSENLKKEHAKTK